MRGPQLQALTMHWQKSRSLSLFGMSNFAYPSNFFLRLSVICFASGFAVFPKSAHFAIERIKVRLVGSDNLLMKAIKLKQFLQQNQKTIIYHYYLAQFRVLTSYLKRYYLQLTLKTQFFIMNHQQLKMFNMVVHQIYGMLDLKEIRVFNLQLIIFND
ncbi:Hypothetical_protein [Hexamita inflata]|uniref:Hypothetical_protein n=1 Tax=Hexamita inflata TaxID=28002 RepID=A0AA86QRA2_9EUKA|nr:Hypothetical protein HINF_LOCUS44185 [Hexamita inflata]